MEHTRKGQHCTTAFTHPILNPVIELWMAAAATPFHTKNKILPFQGRSMTCSDRRKQSDLTSLLTPHTAFFSTAYPAWIGLCAESESDASG